MDDTELIVFDDNQGRWGPLVDLRPIFNLRSGCWDSLKRIEAVRGRKAGSLIVPGRLEQAVRAGGCDYLVNALAQGGDDFLIVNGRWLGLAHSDAILGIKPQTVVMQEDQELVAARVNRKTAEHMLNALSTACDQNWVLFELQMDMLETVYLPNGTLVKRPWDLLAALDEAIDYDAGAIDLGLFDGAEQGVSGGVTVLGDGVIKVGQGVSLGPMVVLDTRGGGIVIDESAEIGAFSVIEGPCYVGKGTKIRPQTHLAGGVALGDCCVIGGEVEASIIQGYSNKAHGGYLGHSVLGQWVNLGAGTNVSNLKNTYGHIRIRLDMNTLPEDTQRCKLGAIIGDFVKTAIGTKLNTGSCLGTGTMIAVDGTAPKLTDCFSFVTKAGDQVYDLDKFMHTSKIVLDRRGKSLDVHQIQLLQSLFEVMEEERQYRLIAE